MIYYILVLILFALDPNLHANPLTVNVLSRKNGKGLEMDQKILTDALGELGCQVRSWDFHSQTTEKLYADVNIFFEILNPAWFPYAAKNWFVPNPEWYCQDLALLDELHLILCRTREVERIFKDLKKPTFFLGFTSKDCYDPLIEKDYTLFFHLAGGSIQKGSMPILSIWQNNFQLPLLTVIKHHHHLNPKHNKLNWISHIVDAATLSTMQNRHGIHLCPSETEGFGHYIMEALSTKAVVITTDAPPMNEFVSNFLVPYQFTAPKALGINYYVDQEKLEKTILSLINTPISELQAIGKKNRKTYLKKTREFKNNLYKLILNTKTEQK